MHKIQKWSYVIALFWAMVIALSLFSFPNVSKLVEEKGQITVPSTSQSYQASKIMDNWGHHISGTRNMVLVFSSGNSKLTSRQKESISKTVNKLKNNKGRYHIKSMTSATDSPELEKQLISKDGKSEIVQVSVSKYKSVSLVEDKLKEAISIKGLKTYVTGAEALNNDFTKITEEGVKKTEAIAIIFIIIVLLFVFKSPIIPLVSLLTVGISVLASLSLIMNLVKYDNLPLSTFTEVFVVIVLFGIGTDYNILLYHQFKDELVQGKNKVEAVISAIKLSGKTILYSGLSVLIGFGTLGLANFSIYQSASGVAIGVLILLLILLTLNPFFMLLLGGKMFWPVKIMSAKKEISPFWKKLSQLGIKTPIRVIVITAAMLLSLSFTYKNVLNYDNISEMPSTSQAKKGFNIIKKHFDEGLSEPTTIYIKTSQKLNNQESLQQIDRVTNQLKTNEKLSSVLSVTQPTGKEIDSLYVNTQLKEVTQNLMKINNGLVSLSNGIGTSGSGESPATDLQSIGSSTKDIANQLTNIQQQMGGLPAETQNQLAGIVSQLNVIGNDTSRIASSTQSVSDKLSSSKLQIKNVSEQLNQIVSGSGQISEYLQQLSKSSASNVLNIPDQVLSSDSFKKSINQYLSEDKKITQIIVVMKSNPTGTSAMNQISVLKNQVENSLKGTSLKKVQVYVGGQSSSINDVRTIANSDFLRTSIVMLIGIFVALLFVTRSFTQPIYVIGLLVSTYYVSLHLTELISKTFLNQEHLSWSTPFFSFIMLVSLGIDYSIFLIMRYRENLKHGHSHLDAIQESSSKIGRVIISAAIILGGTFAALIPSGIISLIQVATVVIIGLVLLVVLLPVVISAFITLAEKSNV